MLNRKFTFVEVKGPLVTKHKDFGINLEAAPGCFNLVISDQISQHLALTIVKDKGFEPTGMVRYS